MMEQSKRRGPGRPPTRAGADIGAKQMEAAQAATERPTNWNETIQEMGGLNVDPQLIVTDDPVTKAAGTRVGTDAPSSSDEGQSIDDIRREQGLTMGPPPEPSEWTLAASDDDVADDLRALGITFPENVGPDSFDQTQRDTLAASLMRRIAETIAGVEQLEASRDAEVLFVHQRYALETQRLESRIKFLEGVVHSIAEHTKDAHGYVGKKKSRDVSTGTYGYRELSGGPVLEDSAKFIEWAKRQAPGALRVTIRSTYADAREYYSEEFLDRECKPEVVMAAANQVASVIGGELPPGFVIARDVTKYYAKPLPWVAIPGARPAK
jgi:phage host-nuclease inhibitor protein Gam